MPSLTVAGIPSNIILPEGSKAQFVESDLYDICERIRELDENLRVVVLEHVDGRAVFAITEIDRQGNVNLVMRIGPGCKIDALDGRVIDHLNWIRAIPADVRAAQIEKEIAAERAYADEQKAEKLYEDMGQTLYDNLFKCGFVMTPRPESRTPTNATARRHGRSIG